MRKVLKWGVVPLNLEGHGMDHHSFTWASTNSPVNIRRFNSTSARPRHKKRERVGYGVSLLKYSRTIRE